MGNLIKFIKMKVSAIVALIASAQALSLNGIYDTVPAGWSGQQVPGREFERPDTGLDDDTVLKKKAGAGHHYPHLVEVHAAPITGDSGLYDSVPAGWAGQQVPG